MNYLSSAVLFLLLMVFLSPLYARVVRVEIASRADVLNGKAFGDVGAYERITGRVYFSLTVENPHNRGIVDLDKAVNLKNGEVEFSADFIAVRPKKRQQGKRLHDFGGAQSWPRAHPRTR